MGKIRELVSVSVLKIEDDPPTWEAIVYQYGDTPMQFYASSRDEALRQVGCHLLAVADAKREAAEVAV